MRITAFAAALFLGTFVASFFGVNQSPRLDDKGVAIRHDPAPHHGVFGGEDLLGTWKGSWGYNSGDCTIEITRVEGEAFFGTLRKEGAEILFEGTFDPATRALFFQETKVVRLGAAMSIWSLGENRGSVSSDGRLMYGTGVDEWGQYAWAVSNR